MKINLNKNWKILQDVRENGEKIGLYKESYISDIGNQISEWEELSELKQLQLIYANKPYFGRELRYFNIAPWWYKNSFELKDFSKAIYKLKFTNVDYFCRVFLNDEFIGEHEGYSMPFEFDISKYVRKGINNLFVKVWSPWDDEVLDDNQPKRTFNVIRNNIKGTYEHSDTFIQRDCNPVGIYGDVSVEIINEASFNSEPEINYELDKDLKNVNFNVNVDLLNVDLKDYEIRFTCVDEETKLVVSSNNIKINESGKYVIEANAKDITLWSTWDKYGPYLYKGIIEIIKDNKVIDSYSHIFGIRKIEIDRDEKKTCFMLNNKKIYMRGTAYFPDLYVSNMCYERYLRDMEHVKALGFNMIRVHVHIDLPYLYEICTKLGIGIMQDSEYNWVHPVTDEFADRFIRIYLDTVRMLKKHTSMFCWINMNEPGLKDPRGTTNGRAMTINPGPRLYKLTSELDPTRPIIKGSFCEDDLCSGDSHNYTGSLHGEDGHYTDIYGTFEKLNTEFGFDAIPCLYSLKQCKEAYERLKSIENKIEDIQDYQYRLTKYYIEHYRMQKYAPNSGYGQFLFSDMCPQSFYGVYDYYGLPKKGALAALESNQAIGVFLKFSKDHIDDIYVVNDNYEEYKNAEVTIVFTDGNNKAFINETIKIDIPEDGIIKVKEINIDKKDRNIVSCAIIVKHNGKIITKNHYEDIFNQPIHVKDHPARMDHEVGVRLYSSEYGR